MSSTPGILFLLLQAAAVVGFAALEWAGWRAEVRRGPTENAAATR